MIRIHSPGKFTKTMKFLNTLKDGDIYKGLDQYGKMGVDALRSATPIDTRATADAWTYNIDTARNGVTIRWNNTNENDGAKIAILLQYGHGTGTGGYVVGRDYINPAIQPIFDKIADEVWKKVRNA